MAFQRMTDADREEVGAFIARHWGSRVVMSRGQAYQPHELDAVLQRSNGAISALATFRADEQGLEVLTMNSTDPGHGVGTMLMLAVLDEARRRTIERVWLTTTNDNLDAIRFYQRLGFRMIEVRVGAVDEARKIKPQIPLIGKDGMAIHDEIVMEARIEPFIESA